MSAEGGTRAKRKPLDPSLHVRGEQPYVALPLRATPPVRKGAQALVGDVVDWAARRGVEPTGSPFFRFRTTGGPDAHARLEVGVPVARPVTADAGVVPGLLPAGPYAVAVHRGHPDFLDEAHDELQAWMGAQDLRPALRQVDGGAAWEARLESFLIDPERQPDPARWSIEIAYLLDVGTGDEEVAP